MWVVFNYNPDVWNAVGIFDIKDKALENMCEDSTMFYFNSSEEDNLKEFLYNINLVRKNIVKYEMLSKRIENGA